ncbi:type 1 glutamine amidotransferase [Meridianimarinicoccus sp. RP-17]|uniref:type 1 glutamine amidotransferase n=1 Tax=Meridianimarinicoccus zhengii TaxID=2056810 RepID=UPI000DAF1FDE|nr:type 1 glutamine amidotransferase [Phycocomes zhengii]
MHIGILECGPVLPDLAARHGTYGDIFARLLDAPGRRFTGWAVHEMAFPEGPDAADGWLLSGSRYGAYDPMPFIQPLEDFIRAARDARIPMVGICFGHQIMAQALGGRVEKSAKGWGFGRQTYAIDGLGEVALSAIHQDQVTRAPDGAELIGRNDFCPIAALRYGDWGLSVQPHPEFDPALMGEFLDLRDRDGEFDEDLIAQARSVLDKPHDCTPVAAWLGDFLEEAALGQRTRPEGPGDHVAASTPARRRA